MNQGELITQACPEVFSHITATIRDLDSIVELQGQPVTGYTVARFLQDRYAHAWGKMGANFWRAVAAVADDEIDAILQEPQASLADCFMMFDRTCLGGRS